MAAIKRTVFAQQGFDFSSHFTIQFARLKVAGGCMRTPQLNAPQGDSTGGGKQALQHITLNPEQPGFSQVTVGWVNVPNKSAMLRTYVCLQKMHAATRRPFDVEPTSYQQFFDNAKGFLAQQGMQVKIEMEPPAPISAAASQSESSGLGIKIFILIAGLFLLAAIVAALLVVFVL